MSNRPRLGLIAVAALVAVVAFVALKPDDEESNEGSGASTATTTTERPSGPPPPRRIVLRGGVPRGGAARIEASKGDVVRIAVSSDKADEIHLHGYDIQREAAPGRPARFRLTADVEGSFELESHTAEDAGREPVFARLVVEP